MPASFRVAGGWTEALRRKPRSMNVRRPLLTWYHRSPQPVRHSREKPPDAFGLSDHAARIHLPPHARNRGLLRKTSVQPLPPHLYTVDGLEHSQTLAEQIRVFVSLALTFDAVGFCVFRADRSYSDTAMHTRSLRETGPELWWASDSARDPRNPVVDFRHGQWSLIEVIQAVAHRC